MTTIGDTFRTLHQPGTPFILANAWDQGSAKMLAALGAQALGTSSAAHAFTVGRPDMGTLSRDEALAHAEDIVAATPLPVQGDFENGFGAAPEICAETVRLAAEVGLAGICIEDTDLPGEPPYPFDLAVDRIKAAACAARALPHDFVLTARADGVMLGTYDVDEAIRRLQAFAAAGADCLFAPVLPDLKAAARLVKSVSKPVNILWAGDAAKTPLATYADMGVARVSLGAALARVTQRALCDAAQEMLQHGTAQALLHAIPEAEVDAMLIAGGRKAT